MKPRILLLLFLLICFASASTNGIAAKSDPPLALSEALDFFPAPHRQEAASEPDWISQGRQDLAPLRIDRQGPVLPRHLKQYDLDTPPLRHRWWNYAIYPAFGFPRDMIDGFFGVLRVVPPINLVAPGLVYEVVPTQILMRHPEDRHQWPGTRNHQGHGWLEGDWGFFSNYRHTTFRQVDVAKIEKWKIHNAEIDRYLAGESRKIDESNQAILEMRNAFMDETRRRFDAGSYIEVIHRMTPYIEIDPLNSEARAMLIAALAASAPSLPEYDWAEQTLHQQIWTSSRAVLIPAQNQLQSLRDPANPQTSILEALVAINLRLESHTRALEAAEKLAALEPANLRFRRLQYEIALAGAMPDHIEAAIAGIEDLTGAGSAAALDARGRQALASGNFDNAAETFRRLTTLAPSNAKYHYLQALAHLEKRKLTGAFPKQPVLNMLRQAIRLEQNTERNQLYRQAYNEARKFPERIRR